LVALRRKPDIFRETLKREREKKLIPAENNSYMSNNKQIYNVEKIKINTWCSISSTSDEPPCFRMHHQIRSKHQPYEIILFNLLKPNDTYIYISYRSANLQTLHFKYLFNKYTF